MAARPKSRISPVDGALHRLLDLAAKAVPPSRMAREVEVIISEWMREPEADPVQIKERVDDLRERVTAGVADAEEQVADVDRSEAAAVKQADATLAALVATRDAALRALAAM